MATTISKTNPLRVLIISPLYDIPTLISSKMANELSKVLNSHELIRVDHLNSIFVTPRSIERTLSKHHYPLIIYYGHGKKDVWYHGFWKKLADVGDSKLFRGSIITTMACYSSEILGPQLVHGGAKAYIGNTNEVFGAYNLFEYPYATDFIRVWQNEAIDLLRGWDVESCVNDTKANLYRLANQYRNNPRLKNGELYAQRCEFNAENHTFSGNPLARLPAVIKHRYELDLSSLNRFFL